MKDTVIHINLSNDVAYGNISDKNCQKIKVAGLDLVKYFKI